jgi:hypothetical protein
MTRVRIYGSAATGLALAAMGWWTPTVIAGGVQGDLSRSAGLALLGTALLGAGITFRWATRAPVIKTPSEGKQNSEFRQGFAAEASRPVVGIGRDNVVQLRHATLAQAQIAVPEPEPSLPNEEVERLKDLLHARAAKLRERNGDMAKRHFLRSGVDAHSLAPS